MTSIAGANGTTSDGRLAADGRVAADGRLAADGRVAADGALPRDRPAAAGQPRAAASGPVAELSYFFPAHNEEANLPGLVEEALAALPALADRFEIVIVDDGSRDATPRLADELAERHPEVRAVHHPVNLGYGAALRSGFAASRFERLAFTDGDRQFRVADLAPLLARLDAADRPDVVVGYRIHRADPLVRTVYARLYRLANRIFFGLKVRDVDCACKVFRRSALEGISVESGGAFFSAELLIKLQAAGHRIAEVGVPHYPRTAGSPTGARVSVILRAVRDFWNLRLRLWANPKRALRRGSAILGG
jgi:glycosyltransferase involved in cell wall biosynthesis